MLQKMQREIVKKKTSIGGQALIEGIMMRGPEMTAMAVRHTSGEIVMESWPTGGKNRASVWKLPVFRGVYAFMDSMYYGYKTLMRSAELSGLEEEDEKPKADAVRETVSDGGAESPSAVTADEEAASVKADPGEISDGGLPRTEDVPEVAAANSESKPDNKEKTENKESFFEKFGMTLLMVLSVVLGVAIAVGLFITLPVVLYDLLRKAVPLFKNQIWEAVLEGVMRIILFVGYITVVSLMKDIHRVFMYHGAEHKTIFCYEKGLDLTVENVRRQSRFHPRCGTSFLILMLLIGIIISMFISVSTPVLRTFIKLLTIPLVMGFGYELIKIAGKSDHVLVRAISAPGLWMQRVTTQEPTDDMIECAISALKAVIPDDPDADRL